MVDESTKKKTGTANHENKVVTGENLQHELEKEIMRQKSMGVNFESEEALNKFVDEFTKKKMEAKHEEHATNKSDEGTDLDHHNVSGAKVDLNDNSSTTKEKLKKMVSVIAAQKVKEAKQDQGIDLFPSNINDVVNKYADPSKTKQDGSASKDNNMTENIKNAEEIITHV